MTDDEIEHVSDTALWVAAYRAQETERPDALFRDPLAARLVGDRGRKFAAEMTETDSFRWAIVIRTVIIDQLILEALGRGADTILNLGAGLDTRPYRMALPASLRWIEVDYPSIVALKEERLQGETPACQLERVAMDLAQTEERRQLFAKIERESKQVLVLTEGVVYYLSYGEAAALARDLRAYPCFRWWIVDYTANWLMQAMRWRGVFNDKLRNTPFKFTPRDFERFFRDQGWKLTTMRYHSDVGNARGRPGPLPWGFQRLVPLLPRRLRRQVEHMMGHALLEPA